MAETQIIKHGNRLKDLSGKRFGKLLVIQLVEPKGRRLRWECVCDCGTKTVVVGHNLPNGHTQSCGCLGIERRTESLLKHGMSNAPEYHAWKSAMHRCINPRHPEYQRYGARGIFMCDRWMNSFDAFLADMGPRPDGMTLDRINNDGPYTGPCSEYPTGNCRWTTTKEQTTNRRVTIWITHHGETLCLKEWALRFGIHYSTLRKRYDHGRPLFDPVNKAYSR